MLTLTCFGAVLLVAQRGRPRYGASAIGAFEFGRLLFLPLTRR